ncbi:MAG: large conductance mechanosensitive channel protein MscL [Chitinophagaceae bacterium]|nr:large conductance mechanosensitive channel protein MscL [Chitinophagaceae bacterium]HQW92369.1 large conductance mechanosensitive channel protein MscL [Ferruginibacter sp.]MBK7122216.1 large conductance mechanosensitive channel protein MscL [Chitinophagaceae bacterium]MBK7557938.1 large conductance mechanosensitive channel protein MscL [Chitinophagaceae bacterium]MBK8493907.1 large conductance mechanosensitive channel protein MscL [Chitinophagaceae bacterium]
MGFIKEFKEFAMKGSLVDIAVAFVMGGAFGKVITSFTEGIVSPLIGMIGGADLSKNVFVLKEGVKEVKDAAGVVISEGVAEVAVKWGDFLTAIINFIIVAFVMFLVIKAINKMKKKQEEAPAGPSTTDALLMEIRDSLKK